MKSWISAWVQMEWRCEVETVEGESQPRRMLERMVPEKSDGSWETRENAERYVGSEMEEMGVEERRMLPDWGV
jgi:hypothetical protein